MSEYIKETYMRVNVSKDKELVDKIVSGLLWRDEILLAIQRCSR